MYIFIFFIGASLGFLAGMLFMLPEVSRAESIALKDPHARVDFVV